MVILSQVDAMRVYTISLRPEIVEIRVAGYLNFMPAMLYTGTKERPRLRPRA